MQKAPRCITAQFHKAPSRILAHPRWHKSLRVKIGSRLAGWLPKLHGFAGLLLRRAVLLLCCYLLKKGCRFSHGATWTISPVLKCDYSPCEIAL